MNKDNIIVISTFPNTLEKISFLQEQLYYFNRLKIPVLVISGCDVPAHLNYMIDYLIINKENERLDRDFTYKCIHDLKLKNTANLWIELPPVMLSIYTYSMNSTITKNIKLSLQMAKNLGYKNVFFTEDDNIFKDGSFDFIKKQFDILNEGTFKLCTVHGKLLYGCKMLFVTYFFANIDFFLEKFTIPHNKEDWYKSENIIKYGLNLSYEIFFYNIFANDIDKVLNIDDELQSLRSLNYIDDGKSTRATDEKWLLDNHMNVFVDKNKNKYLILINGSDKVRDQKEIKSYNVEVSFNDELPYNIIIKQTEFTLFGLNDDIKKVRLKVDNLLDKVIDTNYEVVKFNGLLHTI